LFVDEFVLDDVEEFWHLVPPVSYMTETAGIAVSVAPSQSAYFAGEDLSVIITFTNLNQPSTSYAHHFRQPRTATATAFAPTHHRSSHSVAFPANIQHTSRTASPFVNVAAVPLDSPLAHREAGSLIPRRRGFIGKGKEREDSDDSDRYTYSSAQISPVSQFKRRHHPKSLSVSSPVVSDGTNTRLPKLDTGQPDSPLIDRTSDSFIECVIDPKDVICREEKARRVPNHAYPIFIESHTEISSTCTKAVSLRGPVSCGRGAGYTSS